MNTTTVFKNPYDDVGDGEWLRGNLHAHSTRSDGRHPPQDVIREYARRGYDFLMLSDHDVWTSRDDLAQYDACGMILLPGNEVTSGGPHILHVNAGCRVEPRPHRPEVLEAIALDEGSFAVVCHPNWMAVERLPKETVFTEHLACRDLREWSGYAGVEIYNGVAERLHGPSLATDKWDLVLTEGRRVWGFANDDSHRWAGDAALAMKPDATPLMDDDVALGWNMACVRERTPEALVDALRRGRFYASTGVAIREISSNGTTIRVELEGEGRIAAIRDCGRVFCRSAGPVLEVVPPPDAVYVRFECFGSGGAMAWTQPFFPKA